MTDTYPATFDADVETIEEIPTPTGDELACDWGNAEACRDDNTQRASFAGLALKAYAARVNPSGGEPPEAVIKDLLSDLRHLCDALRDADDDPLNFDALSESADMHYQCELRGEF